ncbi:MAG: tRNA (adenosine(37)-N6)-threonylcarbamoyltransferase complex ATPase subunit type 1 TsaE [Oscillospiraceae bacterium]|jgi:tRNA threonylcarbamoyladenosine biosynthesis protein TsaE|nr:tRNA (adenosine(37)-N6)-threonylcarbamoyltransferase complex ATPase subunit type 1 TsaE [Oscillospiraceae bacterium]
MLTRSVEDTEQYGETLARLLRPGDAVWLYGDLGAGKTALVRGLARGLGVAEPVTSPTYAIVNLYPGRVPLAHYDAYRLGGFDDLLGAGWDEYENGVRAVEWAQNAGGGVSGVCVAITALNETERDISLCFLP